MRPPTQGVALGCNISRRWRSEHEVFTRDLTRVRFYLATKKPALKKGLAFIQFTQRDLLARRTGIPTTRQRYSEDGSTHAPSDNAANRGATQAAARCCRAGQRTELAIA